MSRLVQVAHVIFLVCYSTGAQYDPRTVRGEYRNSAEGFAVTIPFKTYGKAGNAAGPERGLVIYLEGTADENTFISVFGDPNSLEWPTPQDAVNQLIEWKGAQDIPIERSKLGPLPAAEAIVRSGNQATVIVLVFDPRIGTVYEAHLNTSVERYARDRKIFDRIIQSFKLVARKASRND